MGKLEARCTKAITALLMMPLSAGERNPITKIAIEKKRPNLCFRSVTNATRAAQVCIKIDENKAHKKIWYHISLKLSRRLCDRRPITSAMVSNSSESDITNDANVCPEDAEAPEENNDNSLAVKDDDDDRDDVREVTAKRLSTRAFKS